MSIKPIKAKRNEAQRPSTPEVSAKTRKAQSEIPKKETGPAKSVKLPVGSITNKISSTPTSAKETRPAKDVKSKIKKMTPAEIPAEMRDLLLLVIKESQLQDWLYTELPALDNYTPASLIRAGRTAGLMRLIGRSGIY
jgi:hypothetical protein